MQLANHMESGGLAGFVNILVEIEFFSIHYSFHFVFAHQPFFFLTHLRFFHIFFLHHVLFCHHWTVSKQKPAILPLIRLRFHFKRIVFFPLFHFLYLWDYRRNIDVAPCHWRKIIWFKPQKMPLLLLGIRTKSLIFD